MKRLIVVSIILMMLLLWSPAAGGAGALITCTVTIAEPAPFTVEVTSSASNNTVEEGQDFEVLAEIQKFGLISTEGVGIRSGGTVRIKQATARIDFDTSGLTLLKPKQVRNLGTISEKNAKNKSIWWILQGVKAGTYVVQVRISGVNEAGNPVAQQGSVNITVEEPASVTNHGTASSLWLARFASFLLKL